MTDELRRRMARLREIAPRVNAATDQASKLVALVEKFLVEELRIGVSAEVCYEELPAGNDEDNRALRIRHALAFGRSGGLISPGDRKYDLLPGISGRLASGSQTY